MYSRCHNPQALAGTKGAICHLHLKVLPLHLFVKCGVSPEKSSRLFNKSLALEETEVTLQYCVIRPNQPHY